MDGPGPYAPQGRRGGDEVDAAVRHAGEARPGGEVDEVEAGEDAPHAVDLRVVAVGLGDDDEDAGEEQRGGQGGHERVRGGMERGEPGEAAHRGQPRGEGGELGHKGPDGEQEAAAVAEGLDGGEEHGGGEPELGGRSGVGGSTACAVHAKDVADFGRRGTCGL